MKKNISYKLLGLVLLLMVFACTEDDKYDTSVVRQINMFLNGEPYRVNTGITTKPYIIYHHPSGEFFGNYMSHYRFSLENGSYWFVATPAPGTLVPDSIMPTNLNDLVIRQFPRADQQVQISAAVEYKAPFTEPLNLYMINRTGSVRFKALDTEPDNRYKSIRAIVNVQRSGYRVANESYIETPLDVIRSLNTDKGGVNYTDDFVLFNTKDEQSGVQVRFELIDGEGNIVKTRTINEPIQIFPNSMTLVEFKLNDSDEPLIQDYTITYPEEIPSN